MYNVILVRLATSMARYSKSILFWYVLILNIVAKRKLRKLFFEETDESNSNAAEKVMDISCTEERLP